MNEGEMKEKIREALELMERVNELVNDVNKNHFEEWINSKNLTLIMTSLRGDSMKTKIKLKDFFDVLNR
jgi:hypothetical protein